MYQYDHNQRRSGIRLDAQRRRKKQQRKKIIIIALISAILLALFAVLCAAGVIKFGKDNESAAPNGSDSESHAAQGTPEGTETPPITPELTETELVPTDTTPVPTDTVKPPVTDKDTSSSNTTEPLTPDTSTAAGSTDTESAGDSSSALGSSSVGDSSDSESGGEVVVHPPENRFEWPCVLKESAPVGDDYFADTLFIGDSRMQGVEIACSKESKATFFTAVSVTASQIDTRDGVKVLVNGEVKKMTIIDAIKHSGRQFKRIYMMFGINELGSGGGTPAIIRGYKSAIEKVRAIQPNAEICVLGVMPVFDSCKYVSGYKGYEANPRILDLNIAMIEMANEMKLHYLDTYHRFAAEDGQLRSDSSSEGIHLSGAASRQLMEYLTHHAILK